MQTTLDMWLITDSQPWIPVFFADPLDWKMRLTSSITVTAPTGISLVWETLEYPGNMPIS